MFSACKLLFLLFGLSFSWCKVYNLKVQHKRQFPCHMEVDMCHLLRPKVFYGLSMVSIVESLWDVKIIRTKACNLHWSSNGPKTTKI
jgi:hypothetical protein